MLNVRKRQGTVNPSTVLQSSIQLYLQLCTPSRSRCILHKNTLKEKNETRRNETKRNETKKLTKIKKSSNRITTKSTYLPHRSQQHGCGRTLLPSAVRDLVNSYEDRQPTKCFMSQIWLLYEVLAAGARGQNTNNKILGAQRILIVHQERARAGMSGVPSGA